MCLVLDMNVFNCVFDKQNSDHHKFKPVYDWLIHGNGKLVIGGTKYYSELAKMPKYIKFFAMLERMSKLAKVSDGLVDSKEAEVRAACPDRDFDDQHMVALLAVSGCQIFCSEDSRSYPYIKDRRWYGGRGPRIYRSTSFRRAGSLLNDGNIAAICKPCRRLNRKERQAFN